MTWLLTIVLLIGAALCHVKGAKKGKPWGKPAALACGVAAAVVFVRVSVVLPALVLLGVALWAYLKGARKGQEWGKPAVVACTIGLVVMFLGRQFGCYSTVGGGSMPQVYFYDVEDGDLFTAKATKQSPSKTLGGHEAVRAHVFHCTDCRDEADRIVYYSKWSDKALGFWEKYPAGTPPPDDKEAFEFFTVIEHEHLLSQDAKEWVSADSPEGMKIMQFQCPDGSIPQECLP